MTADLVAFLRARLDADEQAAQDAGGKAWKWEQHYGDMCNDPTCEYGELATDDTVLMNVHGYDIRSPWQGAAHIERHHPARVLADIEATRKIVDGLAELDANPALLTDAALHLQRHVLLSVVLQLAAVHAGHPDYRPEWRP
ncbi:DUF6221 family protein [Streptomyces sp. BB1-1-1]|uniref:DUF6221 family protein n=1 Tax=Streptomyces sp. BB1-1-1 TaxID=3074430 RepID=UPI0028776B89|nr:DUF6221 family protein [Streptomyces sp. BB1-1-1]WND33976.1 DUF6221 family protein [Streptomyces sp. BB1-1-1]